MTAIEFENISKQYQLGKVGTGTLSKDLNRWWAALRGQEDPYLKIGQINNRAEKAEGDFVWALRDISFKVEQGDVVGIIGKNGSGKSTLLKILSKVTSPTTGRIRGRGRVASLLEVGTGFHPEMTGRENIYMNGAIMGMTKSEIDRKLDEIVDFAGVQMYVDTPVKRYSSGMMVRLGFAVAAHLEPEILVVDEVLAVGDAEFQKKAIGKMQDVAKGEGRTVLFVSHNMAAVRSLCSRGVVLQNGQMVFEGSADNAVDFYLECNDTDLLKETIIGNEHRRSVMPKDLEIVSTKIENKDNRHLSTDSPILMSVKVRRNNPNIKKYTIGFHITDHEDRRVGAYISPIQTIISDNSEFEIKLILENHNLAKGKYAIDFNVGLKVITIGETTYDSVFGTLSFEIIYLHDNVIIADWQNQWGRIHFQNVKLSINK